MLIPWALRRRRSEALAERVAAARAEVETLPGAPLVREVLETERDLGGGLIAGGVAFRIFLWLVPFGLVVAALLSFWSDYDQAGLERASREFGIGAAAAEAAAEALESSDRNALLILLFGLVVLASGHATLAMPLLAPLGDFAEVSLPLVVTAWSWGAGIARFITPTSAVVMAGLALAGVRYDKWIASCFRSWSSSPLRAS